jgi:membrane associated rhomboid family serine protease
MTLDQIQTRIEEYFDDHPERLFILKSLFVVFAIILLRFVFSRFLLILIVIFAPFISLMIRSITVSDKGFLGYLRENFTFISAPYVEQDKRRKEIPWVTYGLILVNVLTFYFVQTPVNSTFINNDFVFLPRTVTWWNAPLSMVTAMFLHADTFHLWGNMLFLWATGTMVEKRIGPMYFSMAYLITGLVSQFCFLIVNGFFLTEDVRVIGASGAIAGIMGIFMVRCYFKTMVFPLPLLGVIPFINIKVRLNSLVVIGYYFALDLSGGMGQVSGISLGNVAHWGHLGGMATGILLALRMKLADGAVEERHLEIGGEVLQDGVLSSAACEKGISLNDAERSLRSVLKKNPDNPEALIQLARIRSHFHAYEDQKPLYQRGIVLYMQSQPDEAIAVYREYFSKYRDIVEPAVQYRIIGILYQQGELDLAAYSLEIMLKLPDLSSDIREKALYQYGRILEEMGLRDVAEHHCRQFLIEFPGSAFTDKVNFRLNSEAT